MPFRLHKNCNNKPVIVVQGLAVLAAGTKLKLFDVLGYFFFLILMRFCQEVKQ